MNQPTPPDELSPPGTPPEDATPDTEPEESPATEPDDAPAETPQPEEARAESRPAKPAPRSGRAIAVLAFMIAVAAGAGSAYVFWITQIASQRADTVRADLSGDLARLSKRATELQEQLRALETNRQSEESRFGDLRATDGRLAERLETLENRTARLAKQEQAPVAGDWRRAELEGLLRIANQQATLGRDPEAALAALREADSLLQSMADPSLQRVRGQVADDILALQSAPRPDVQGIALRLGSLARRVDSLPLAGQHESGSVAATAGEGGGGIARPKAKIAEFFGSIFRVRPAEGPATPLLAPEESFFLRRNLELELQAARIAVLEGDESVYQASIGSARRWVEAYFRTDDAGVQGFLNALGELEGRQIQGQIPDISGSLAALLATESDKSP